MQGADRFGKGADLKKGWTIIKARNSVHQNIHANAMQSGLYHCGIQSKQFLSTYNDLTDKVATWGWRFGKDLFQRGHSVLVMERGYVGDRFKYTSLGWNGLNNHAVFPSYPDDGGERFRAHGGFIKPWKKHGEYILILGQVKGDASLQGKDLSRWYEETAKKARDIYDLPVYFRAHPDSQRRGGYTSVNGIENKEGTLQDALDGALFTIAYNSNSCLDSILAGVPCFAGDKGTMAWDLCMPSLDKLEYPERERVVHSIAWTQWTIEEISQGIPIKALIECKP